MALGILELICTVGLIVPATFHWRPALTVVAATVLTIESIVFIGVHANYREIAPHSLERRARPRNGVHHVRPDGPEPDLKGRRRWSDEGEASRVESGSKISLDHFREALHLVMMLREQVGHLLIELAKVLLDQSQFLERQLQQPTIHRMQRRARAQGVGQLSGCRAEALVGQRRHCGRVSLAIG
jgi:hypothetical protein